MIYNTYEMADKIKKAGIITKIEFLPFHRAWIAFHLNGSQSQITKELAKKCVFSSEFAPKLMMSFPDIERLHPELLSPKPH